MIKNNETNNPVKGLALMFRKSLLLFISLALGEIKFGFYVSERTLLLLLAGFRLMSKFWPYFYNIDLISYTLSTF